MLRWKSPSVKQWFLLGITKSGLRLSSVGLRWAPLSSSSSPPMFFSCFTEGNEGWAAFVHHLVDGRCSILTKNPFLLKEMKAGQRFCTNWWTDGARLSVQHAISKSIFKRTGSNACNLLILALHNFENNYSHVLKHIFFMKKSWKICVCKKWHKNKKTILKTQFSQKNKFSKLDIWQFFPPAWHEKIRVFPHPPLTMLWSGKKTCPRKWQFCSTLNRGVGAVTKFSPIFSCQAWKVQWHMKTRVHILTPFYENEILRNRNLNFGFV